MTQGIKRVECTPREFRMEMSMQALVKKNQQQLVEIAQQAGDLAYVKHDLADKIARLKDLEWEVSHYRDALKKAGVPLPEIPPRPPAGQRTESIPIPIPTAGGPEVDEESETAEIPPPTGKSRKRRRKHQAPAKSDAEAEATEADA